MSAALPASPAFPSCWTSTTTVTGWRWPSTRSTGDCRGIRGTARELDAVVRRARQRCTTTSPRARAARWSRRPTTSEHLFGGWAELAAADGAPAGPRRVGRAAPRPAGRARVGLAGSHRGADAGPRRHPLGQHPACGPTASCSSTGPTPPSARRSSTSSPGRPRSCSRVGPPPEELLARHATARRRTPTSSPCCSPRSAGSSWRTRCGRRRPGCRPCARFQAAQGEVALAWLRRRTGW